MFGSLRISTQVKPDLTPQVGKSGAVSETPSSSSLGDPDEPPVPSPGSPDDYLRRLVLLVPAEVITLYLTFRPGVVAFEGEWAAVCLVLVGVVRTIGTKQQGKPIQWLGVLIASVSFVLWVLAMGHTFLGFKVPEEQGAQGIVSAAIGVWTFLIPFVYRPK